MTFIDGIDQSRLPVFQQRWWLDTARGADHYVEAQVSENGVLVGSLPYILRRSRVGFKWGAAPDWSHLGGPAISHHLSEPSKFDVIERLIAQLPRNVSFGFTCSPAAGEAALLRRAFTTAGFVHSTETTYSQSPDQANVLGRLTRKHRLHIKSAAKSLEVTEISAQDFIDFYADNLAAAGIKTHTSLEVARNLMVKGKAADTPQVRITAARSLKSGHPLDAAVACAWDSMRYYFWMSTRRRQSDSNPHDRPHPDAIKLLIVIAMAHARDLGLVFDADGVSVPGARTLYGEILKMPNEEFRDIFIRQTRLARWHTTNIDKFKKIAALLTYDESRCTHLPAAAIVVGVLSN